MTTSTTRIREEANESLENGGDKDALFEDLSIIMNTLPNASDYTKEEYYGTVGDHDDVVTLSYNDGGVGEFISQVTHKGRSVEKELREKLKVDDDHPAMEHLENAFYALIDGEFTPPGNSIASLVVEFGEQAPIDECLEEELIEEWENH